MHYIDGHNLIPKMPGGSLREIDDELILIEQLQVFSRIRRKKVMVYFDNAPPGLAGQRTYGTVLANFVPQGSTADDAIRRDLAALGKRACTITVVSSDRSVQAGARRVGASVVSAEAFAGELLEAGEAARRPETPDSPPGELGEWLDLFGIDPQQADQPIEPPSGPRRPKRKERKKRSRHGFTPK